MIVSTKILSCAMMNKNIKHSDYLLWKRLIGIGMQNINVYIAHMLT